MKGMMKMTGNELCETIKKSPQELYRALIEEYGGYVYAIAINKLKNVCSKDDIDECVSDIFAEIFLKYDAQKANYSNLKGYIGIISKRRAIDYFRKFSGKNKNIVSIDDEKTNDIVSEQNIEATIEKKELSKILFNKITELGEPDSEIIIRKFYYNQNSTEIAKRLSLKASTVRSRCKRAIKRLETMLSEVGISM